MQIFSARLARRKGADGALRLLLDDTVLVDFIGERRETCACRDKLNALQITGTAELWTTVFFYERLLARLERELPGLDARRALISMAEFVEVCSFDEEDMIDALWDEKPFLLSTALICAGKLKADCFITYDGDLISLVPEKACTPEGFFEGLEIKRGIVFELVDF